MYVSVEKVSKMKFRYLEALLCFDWDHYIWNKFRNGHIVGINEVIMSPIELFLLFTQATLCNNLVAIYWWEVSFYQ